MWIRATCNSILIKMYPVIQISLNKLRTCHIPRVHVVKLIAGGVV